MILRNVAQLSFSVVSDDGSMSESLWFLFLDITFPSIDLTVLQLGCF